MLKRLAYRILSVLLSLLLIATQVAANDWVMNSYRFGPANPSISFQACYNSTSDLTTYSFTSSDIGTAGATRTVIVGVSGQDDAQDYGTTSVSIDGTAANEQVDTGPGSASSAQTSIWTLNVASGTTATISVTFTEAVTGAAICVWAAYDLNSAAVATATNKGNNASGSSVTLSLNVPANGIAVGMCTKSGGVSTTFTTTGMTERADSNNAESLNWTAVDITQGASAAVPLTSVCTPATGGSPIAGASASFGNGPALQYVANSGQSNPAGTAVTFSSISTGVATSDRTTVIAACGTDSATVFSVTGLTVGGTAATKVAESPNTATRASRGYCSVWVIANSSDTTATIVVTYSELLTGTASITVWAGYALPLFYPGTNAGTLGTSGAATALNLNTAVGDFVVAACASPTGSGTATWTGLTKRVDSVASGSLYTAASDAIFAASTPLSVNCDPSSNTDDVAGVSAAFGTSYPVVVGSTDGNNTAATVSINVPPGAVGELLLALVGTDANSSTTWPSGWTSLFNTFSTSDGISAAWRIADGTEGATISVTSGANWYYAILRIGGNHATAAPEAGTAVSATATTGNPPAVTPTWGAANDLWVVMGHADSGVSVTYPTNYNWVQTFNTNTGTLAVAVRPLNAATEDPGTFGWGGSILNKVNTIAVRPAQ